jgi:hypothetical protein
LAQELSGEDDENPSADNQNGIISFDDSMHCCI